MSCMHCEDPECHSDKFRLVVVMKDNSVIKRCVPTMKAVYTQLDYLEFQENGRSFMVSSVKKK